VTQTSTEVAQTSIEEPKIYTGLILPCPGGIITRHTDNIRKAALIKNYYGCPASPLMSEEHYCKYARLIGIKLYQYKNHNQTKHFDNLGKPILEAYRSYVKETNELLEKNPGHEYNSRTLYTLTPEYVAIRYGLSSWCIDVLLPNPTKAVDRMVKILKINTLVLNDVHKYIGKDCRLDRYVLKSRFQQDQFFKVKAPTLDRLFAFLEKKGAKVATYQDEQSTEEFKIWQKTA
jgi:hypothetical protein